MDDTQYKANLRAWWSPSQLKDGGVLWGEHDDVLPWAAVGQQYMWYRRLGAALKPRRLLEVGVGFGYSTLSLLSGLDTLPEVYWIDNETGWEHSLTHAQECLKNTYGIRARCAPSWLASKTFYTWFDLIHLDAGHTYEDVINDLRHAYSVTLPNAHILVHDTDDPPVSRAIEEFADQNKGFVSVRSFPDVRCGLKVIHSCSGVCPLDGLEG